MWGGKHTASGSFQKSLKVPKLLSIQTRCKAIKLFEAYMKSGMINDVKKSIRHLRERPLSHSSQ